MNALLHDNSDLVSVVMPVFNAEQYLAEAIQSVLAQTHTNLELIAVNDGSTDQSPQILAQFAQCDSRVRIVTIENSGISRALNQGIEASSGPWIARMDSDDVCLPRRLERQLESMKGNPECVVLGTAITYIDEDGEDLCARSMRRTEHSQIDTFHFTGHGSAIAHPTVMLRRDALETVGGYSHCEPCEDIDLWLRLAEVGRLANLPEVLLKYRLRASSLSATMRDVRGPLMESILREASARRGTTLESIATLSSKPYDRSRHARRCVWHALRGGHYRVAAKHARRAFQGIGELTHSKPEAA